MNSTVHMINTPMGRVIAYNEVQNRADPDISYYISYNNHDIDIYGCDTTALVYGQMQAFYILNGDHRDAYSALDSFQDCFEYFNSHREQMNSKSDHGVPQEVIEKMRVALSKL